MDQNLQDKIANLRNSISNVIIGQNEAAEIMLAAIVADGHILLEGVPGVAKTLLAKYMAKLIGAQYGRIQFTPDLMPTDILGTEIYDQNKAAFTFHPGPVFKQLILADEINRAPAKTQAALFEVMEERQVTVAGKTYKMSPLFTIIATQNPIEQEGTYRLPEAQLDRFLCKISMGYPNNEEEIEILKLHRENAAFTSLADIEAVLSPDDIAEIRRAANEVTFDDALIRYIANITATSRQSQEIYLPASPRAAVSMMRMARAYALINGREFATPDDVRAVAPAVLNHRIQLTAEAEMEGTTVKMAIDRFLTSASAEIKD